MLFVCNLSGLHNKTRCILADTAGTRADLASILAALRRSAPPGGQFPCSEHDMSPIAEQFVLHADSKLRCLYFTKKKIASNLCVDNKVVVFVM